MDIMDMALTARVKEKLLPLLEGSTVAIWETNPTDCALVKAAQLVRELLHWRSMDTAPRDGTVIFVRGRPYNDGPGYWYCTAQWHNGAWYEDDTEDNLSSGFKLHEPTEWMPVPWFFSLSGSLVFFSEDTQS